MQLSEAPRQAFPGWCHTISDSPASLLAAPCQALELELAVLMFDEQGFRPGDYGRYGIEPPEVLCRAARKRQAEFLAGRLCAGEALRKLQGVVRFPARDGDGVPVWPSGVNGSITHSDGVAMTAVGDRDRFSGIGLDVEVIQNRTEARALTSLVLTPEEQSRYREGLIREPGLCLTRIFSLKEALFKAVYPQARKRFYFQDAEVIEMDPDGHCCLRLLTRLPGGWPPGTEIAARLGHWRDRIIALAFTMSDRTLKGLQPNIHRPND